MNSIRDLLGLVFKVLRQCKQMADLISPAVDPFKSSLDYVEVVALDLLPIQPIPGARPDLGRLRLLIFIRLLLLVFIRSRSPIYRRKHGISSCPSSLVIGPRGVKRSAAARLINPGVAGRTF